jgi:hypothetical protein
MAPLVWFELVYIISNEFSTALEDEWWYEDKSFVQYMNRIIFIPPFIYWTPIYE